MFEHDLRKTKTSLHFPSLRPRVSSAALDKMMEEGPIEVHDSIGYGTDTLETQVMQEHEFASMADRFHQELPEEPNLEADKSNDKVTQLRLDI